MKTILLIAISSLSILSPAIGQGPAAAPSAPSLEDAARQELENLVRAALAYNALPEKERLASGKPSVRGAFELLQTHAHKHPGLVLNDELSISMEWALVLSDTGKLRSAPMLNQLVEQNMAQASAAQGKRTAQRLCSVFMAAMATDTKDADEVKSVEDIIARLNTGIKGAGAFEGKDFIAKTTPEQAKAAAPHLTFDAGEKTLRYTPKSVIAEVPAAAPDAEPSDAIEVLAKLIASKPEPRRVSQRNVTAQNLASVYGAVIATGSTALDDAKTVEEVIDRLRVGVKGAGPFAERTFMCPTTPEKAAEAVPYLTLDVEKKALLYTPQAATATAEAPPPAPRTATLVRTKPVDPESAARRDAQSLYSTYLSAKFAGCKMLASATSVADIHDMLTRGVNGAGVWQKTKFNVVISAKELKAASPFLKLDRTNGLMYLE